MVVSVVGLGVFAATSKADVTTVTGSACGYYVNVGLFGGPQNLRGCGQPADGPAAGTSPFVTLPPGGSATPITAEDLDGATAQYGPARIFAGLWPLHVASAPPSGPISVSTKGTVGPGGSVESSADIVLRTPANPDSPGGFGPGPVEGDELHATCRATETGVTGSTRFVKGILSTSTDAGGSPVDQEPIPDNPPPNYTRHGVITNVGDVFSVVFNEQIHNADGSLTVNAFHMYLFGPVAVGESVGGQVKCGTSPAPAAAGDKQPPICGRRVVAPVAPDDPTPRVPREELIGVADAGGLQTISNVQVTNGTVNVPPNGTSYLNFNPGQTGPLPITATRTAEAEDANLPMTWSFDATDKAGNVSHCDGQGSPATVPTPTTTTTQAGATTTTQAGGSTSTTQASGGTTTTVAGGGGVGSTTTVSPNSPTTSTTIRTTTTLASGVTTTISPTSTTTAPTQQVQTITGVLARTGFRIGAFVLLSVLALMLGSVLLSHGRRPAPVSRGDDREVWAAPYPEKWGPLEIVRALGGLVMVTVSRAVGKLRSGRRPR